MITEIEWDEIVSIEYIGDKDTIDINTSGDRLFYCNDILVHNSAIDESDHSQNMMAGGISKVNTADNVLSIITSPAMRERGEYAAQFLKTRSSAGVGKKIYLSFDMITLRIGNLSPGHITRQPLDDTSLRNTASLETNTKRSNDNILTQIKQRHTKQDNIKTDIIDGNTIIDNKNTEEITSTRNIDDKKNENSYKPTHSLMDELNEKRKKGQLRRM